VVNEKKVILLIDDDPQVRTVLAKGLEAAGYAVIQAENGEEGQLYLDAGGPDLVVSDILMPVVEGIETILAIRKRNQAIPIIAISGAGRGDGANMLEAARKLGATEILEKPFRPSRLVALVGDLLGRAPASAQPLGNEDA
jgi:DNA-binding response OmpR family regulator